MNTCSTEQKINPDAVKFMIIDDDRVDVRAITRSLSAQCIHNPIVVANNGEEALEILRGQEQTQGLHQPYMILLDLNMPRMNGIEFLYVLRQDPKLKDAIVFMLTTSDNEQDVLDAYELNVAGYIVKSRAGFEFSELVQMLQEFIKTVQFPPERITSRVAYMHD